MDSHRLASSRLSLDGWVAVIPHASLPARLTPLIGRATELAELTDLTEHERVVTLTGSGGCGKTRLAVELVARIADRFPGGIAWVELASCSEFDGVTSALASELDTVESDRDTVLDGLVEALRHRPATLVVLDNAEHVLAAAAQVTAALSSGVEDAWVLCTSREPVGVPGEVVWRVPSLSTPPIDQVDQLTTDEIGQFDGVRLFVDRARRARRGFTMTDPDAAAVAQICTRLDGLPLAIELAAARVRTMPPPRIASLLDDRFRLLAGGPRTLMARQQTLQASVAWSESLLDETERAGLRRLGVFAGGFTLEAAEAVVGAFDDIDGYAVTELVGRLVDKSLVQLDERRDRYSLLETIRSYALQRLFDADEAVRARDAHAEWCAGWLATTGRDVAPDANRWWESRVAIIGRIEPEWPNCANALDWVPPGSTLSLRLIIGLGDYWALRQRATDSARYGMPALLAASPDDPEWLAAVLALQTVRTNAADPEFPPLRERAVAVATERGDRSAVLRLEVGHQITMAMLLGPRDEVIAPLDAIRAEAQQLGEWFTVWNAAQSPAVILAVAGRPSEAEERVAELTAARAMLIRALAAQLRGDLATSARLAAQAQERIDARLGSVTDRILVAFLAAGSALATGDRSVIDALRLSDVRTESLPFAMVNAVAMTQAVGELLDGRLDDARSRLEGQPPDLFTSWRNVCLLAEVELAMGDLDSARATAERLREATLDVPAPQYTTTSDLVLAECETATDVVHALDLAHRALSTAVDAELWMAAVDALEAIGPMLIDVGRTRDAARLLAGADSTRASMGYRYRFAHRAAYVASAHDTVRSSEGWTEGAGLSLTATVELAQRMRGERVRPLAGWESLTPTEQRVVEKVAAGLTNPQVATELLMSRATVKTHLVHVYAKLGIANRAELAAAVARREAP